MLGVALESGLRKEVMLLILGVGGKQAYEKQMIVSIFEVGKVKSDGKHVIYPRDYHHVLSNSLSPCDSTDKIKNFQMLILQRKRLNSQQPSNPPRTNKPSQWVVNYKRRRSDLRSRKSN